ncbi:MAG TPA: hypothetical protein VHH11_13850 [Gammaproteobacteria bacterium]|nr:hypothetical protein [Gammaproteobacteria bacterium]
MGQDMYGAGRHFNVWVLARPAADLPEQWIAHVLNLDVVTQGNSLAHALDMAVEATLMVLSDDIAEGRNPQARRPAPPECFKELHEVQRSREFVHGTPEEWSRNVPPSAVVAEQIAVCFPHAVCTSPRH